MEPTPEYDLTDFDAVGRRLAEEQAAFERECLDLIVAGGMHVWSPGDPIPTTGDRLLIGYATWSGYDRLLLKIVSEVLTGPHPPPIRVDAFDMDRCQRV